MPESLKFTDRETQTDELIARVEQGFNQFNERILREIQPLPNSLYKSALVRPLAVMGANLRNPLKNWTRVRREVAEKELYDKLGVKDPIDCPECRYKQLISWKNPRKLWARNCAKCSQKIETSYSPDRPETVYCEKCYLETVY